MHATTAALSSLLDSGDHSPFLFSAVGFYYMVGLRVRAILRNTALGIAEGIEGQV